MTTLELAPIDRVALKILDLKEQEAGLREQRIDAEKLLLTMVKAQEEGTVRADTSLHKISVQFSLDRKLDAEKLRTIAAQIPESIGKRLVRFEPKLDLRELRYIQSNEPEIYATFSQALTVKPAKPSVTVEAIENEVRKAA